MRNLRFTIFILAMFALAATPEAASAQVAFRACGDVLVFSQRTVAAISERTLEIETRRLEVLNNLPSRWAEQDMARTIARENERRAREAEFEELANSLVAASAADKQALLEFKAALAAASAERQTAIAAAHSNFRSGVRSVLTARSKDFRAAAEEFVEDVQSSMNIAVAECALGLTLTDVQANLQSRLQVVRQDFVVDPRSGGTKAAEIRALTERHQDEIREATAAFRAQVTNAHADFKAALDS